MSSWHLIQGFLVNFSTKTKKLPCHQVSVRYIAKVKQDFLNWNATSEHPVIQRTNLQTTPENSQSKPFPHGRLKTLRNRHFSTQLTAGTIWISTLKDSGSERKFTKGSDQTTLQISSQLRPLSLIPCHLHCRISSTLFIFFFILYFLTFCSSKYVLLLQVGEQKNHQQSYPKGKKENVIFTLIAHSENTVVTRRGDQEFECCLWPFPLESKACTLQFHSLDMIWLHYLPYV